MSLRNINTCIAPSHFRGKTSTDDDAPYNLDTPTKRALGLETPGLSHSVSFSNLASSRQEAPRTPKKALISSNEVGKSSTRPSGGRLRRRSTLHWSTASPRARQQKLEDLAVHRLADVWFSVHAKDAQDPIYISEVMERSMNPSFAFFDLDAISSHIGRSDECTLRIWARDGAHEDYVLLVELKVNLRSLQYIGKHLEDFHHPLPQNAVLLHLSDGIYTSFTDLPGDPSGPETSPASKLTTAESGSSFDALMQLANLDECIQDALKLREQLEQEVNDLISELQSKQTRRQLAEERYEELGTTKSALTSLTRQKSQAEKRKDELRTSIQMRRDVVTASHNDSGSQQTRASLTQTVYGLEDGVHRVSERSQGQIHRIAEALLFIFPVEAMKNRALHFSIRNIYLPNSVFDDTNRDEIAAALGYTAQLVHKLSIYLSTALPYPIDLSAASSLIQDPISMSIAQRKYPLYPTNVAYKFEYAVFLLNKDIEFLMCKAGLRILDIRHTLPNLKYLLYILTAGSGELSTRKAGGVRGLLGGRFTPNLSRRGSEESVRGQKEYMKRTGFDSRHNGGTVPVQIPTEKQAELEDSFAVPLAPAILPPEKRNPLSAAHR